MKFNKLSVLLLSGVVGLASCGKDDDATPTKVKTAFTTTKTDTLWNLAGPKKGAYDLVNMVNKGSSDADGDKDMANTTTADDLSSGITFRKEFVSKNATRFVNAGTSVSFESAYKELVDSVYKANSSSATATISGVLNNSVYIAKLRDGSNYALIKVIAVNDDGKTLATGGNNNDNIIFSYKK